MAQRSGVAQGRLVPDRGLNSKWTRRGSAGQGRYQIRAGHLRIREAADQPSDRRRI